MTGILVTGHGSFAAGLLDAARLFFGELPQTAALMLNTADSTEEFRTEMAHQLAALDTGDGVLILADLFGGTPCNCAMALQSERVQVLAGANLPMLMEALGSRDTPPVDAAAIAQAGKESILFTALLNDHENEEF